MVNYQNGKIYKIETTLGDEIYIGSTTKHLSQRMLKHKSGYKLWKLGKGSKIMSYEIFDKYGFENCRIILLQYCVVNSKVELHEREGNYVRSTNCVNKTIPGRGRNESRMVCHFNKKVENNEKAKEYYYKNRDKLNEKVLCDCGKYYLKCHKNRHEISSYHKVNLM